MPRKGEIFLEIRILQQGFIVIKLIDFIGFEREWLIRNKFEHKGCLCKDLRWNYRSFLGRLRYDLVWKMFLEMEIELVDWGGFYSFISG